MIVGADGRLRVNGETAGALNRQADMQTGRHHTQESRKNRHAGKQTFWEQAIKQE